MIIEWVMIVVGTAVSLGALGRIARRRSSSIADILILLVYAINCIPVLLDLWLGFPQYQQWFWRLQDSMRDPQIRVYYAWIMLVLMLSLQWYIMRHLKGPARRYSKTDPLVSVDSFVVKHRTLTWIAVLAPYLLVAAWSIARGLDAFLMYGSLTSRGIPATIGSLISMSLLGSLLFSVVLFFSKPRTLVPLILLLSHFAALVWIDGKRYLIPTILLTFIFCYVNTSTLKVANEVIIAGAVLFSLTFIPFFLWYTTEFKSSDVTSNEGIYATLRLDFGRDDVTKFAISRAIDGAEPILEYPGQGLLGTVLMPVPRSLYPEKPYPYYRYLSGRIFGLPIDTIPAGMTPSLIAMNVSDWGVTFGTVCTVVLLLCMCRFADSRRTLFGKLSVLLTGVGLLTQSPDAFVVPLACTFVLIVWSIFPLREPSHSQQLSLASR